MSAQSHTVSWKGRSRIRLFPFLLLIILIAGMFTFPFEQYLVIRDTRTNQLLWKMKAPENSTFSIQWTHSIHRTPVEEYYVIHNRQIELTRMSFKDYGIGMNSQLASGEQLIMEEGKFVIANMKQIFPALHLFVGQVRAHHTIHVGEFSMPLEAVAQPGTAITISVEQQSIVNLLGGDFIREHRYE